MPHSFIQNKENAVLIDAQSSQLSKYMSTTKEWKCMR